MRGTGRGRFPEFSAGEADPKVRAGAGRIASRFLAALFFCLLAAAGGNAAAPPAPDRPSSLSPAPSSGLPAEDAASWNASQLLAWEQLPPLPDPHGVAGPFAGVSGRALLVAGGANFPEKKPWEGGTKVWHDEVHVLPEGGTAWTAAGRLPRPLAYGVSVTIPEGVLCIGGDDAEQSYADVFLLRWDGAKLAVEEYPPLPAPLAYAAGVLCDGKVYVMGGSERTGATEASAAVRVLDLAAVKEGWKELDPLPAPGRILPVAAVLSSAVYLCSGAALAAGPDGKPVRTYLADAWRFTPGEGWKRLADLPRPAVAAPSPAPAFGGASFLVLGGDDGSLAGRPAAPDHPGFPRSLLSYQPVTDTWTVVEGLAESRATVPAVEWNGRMVLASGEVRPGVRTPAMAALRLEPGKAGFGALNYATLILYLLFMLGIGVYCSRFNRNTEDFFRGGQRIPWWAAGLSIFATTLSSITFMAVPAKAFAENWVFALANLPILLLAPFIVFLILPVFRRIDATSAYEYLEKRFNLAVRLFGAGSFTLLQLGRMAVVLYLPALALAAVTDLNIYTCIALMGVLSVFYCVIGGITAVIWTDVAQSFILLGGALLSLILIVARTDGGWGGVFDVASADGKFRMVNWTWDYTVASLWVVLVGNLFSNLIPYTSDQAVVQRYMTTRDEKTAARSIWLNGLIAVPATAIFFLVGTALYVYYMQHPSRLMPGLKTDQVFPQFIAWELPAGVAGLVVAGIFAAAQSTISTSVNSMSTVLMTDFVGRLRTGRKGEAPSAAGDLFLAKVLTGLLGALGTAAAFLLASIEIRSLWDAFLQILGLAGGALAGLFMLGIFTTRANGTGALIGACASVAVLYMVQRHTPVHFFLYAPIGIITCAGVGYAASLLTPPPPAGAVRGLTSASIRARRRDEETAATDAGVQPSRPVPETTEV